MISHVSDNLASELINLYQIILTYTRNYNNLLRVCGGRV